MRDSSVHYVIGVLRAVADDLENKEAPHMTTANSKGFCEGYVRGYRQAADLLEREQLTEWEEEANC